MRPVCRLIDGVEITPQEVIKASRISGRSLRNPKAWEGTQLRWVSRLDWAEMAALDRRSKLRLVVWDRRRSLSRALWELLERQPLEEVDVEGLGLSVLVEGYTPYEVLDALLASASDLIEEETSSGRLVWLGLELGRHAWGMNVCAPDNPWREAEAWDQRLQGGG